MLKCFQSSLVRDPGRGAVTLSYILVSAKRDEANLSSPLSIWFPKTNLHPNICASNADSEKRARASSMPKKMQIACSSGKIYYDPSLVVGVQTD